MGPGCVSRDDKKFKRAALPIHEELQWGPAVLAGMTSPAMIPDPLYEEASMGPGCVSRDDLLLSLLPHIPLFASMGPGCVSRDDGRHEARPLRARHASMGPGCVSRDDAYQPEPAFNPGPPLQWGPAVLAGMTMK